jgi:hypothetical protein
MTTVMQKTDVKTTTPPLHMPNAASIAENVLDKALEFCTRKLGVKDHKVAIDRLQQKECRAYEYCYYSIAQQVGTALGNLDDNVKAAYMFEYEATPEDLCFGETQKAPLLHLLVWTHRKTEALDSLAEVLDRALAHSFAQLVGPQQLQHLLDVQIIDDTDVENRVGYGSLLHSLHHRPLKVWER